MNDRAMERWELNIYRLHEDPARLHWSGVLWTTTAPWKPERANIRGRGVLGLDPDLSIEDAMPLAVSGWHQVSYRVRY